MKESSFVEKHILLLYFVWHYKEAPGKLIGIWKNFLRFNFRFFSISFLVKTYFLPWKRIVVGRGRGFSFKDFFEAAIFNLFSRFIGMFLRAILIIAGLVIELFILVGGFFIFILWFCLPPLAAIGIIFGIILLF